MEGSGASHAAHLNGQDALVIRGISDRANPDKHEADASGSQQRAAKQAAAVAAAILRKQQPRIGSPDPEDGSSRGHTTEVTYGGDHIDFRGSTFHGPVTGKTAGPRPDNGQR